MKCIYNCFEFYYCLQRCVFIGLSSIKIFIRSSWYTESEQRCNVHWKFNA